MKKQITSVINYFPLKEMLTEKYGEPSGYLKNKMRHIRFDKCKYYTTYETEEGTIQLSIEYDGLTNFFVELAYWEKINSGYAKSKKHKLRQLTDEFEVSCL